MTMIGRSMMLAGAMAVGLLGFGAVPARAQAVGFGYAGPGVSFGFSTGGYTAFGYPGPVVGAYAPVVGAPVIVGAPVVVPRPVIVPGPVVVPRVYYGGGFYRGGPYYRGYHRYGYWR